MAPVDDPDAYRAGRTSYAVVGALYRASFARVAASPTGVVGWRVWGAVMAATASRSKLRDRTSLNALAVAAGVRRKGGGGTSARRAEARAVGQALRELERSGAITYVPAKGGRPVEGGFAAVVVGLPDPDLMGVELTPIPEGKWGSNRSVNGGQTGPLMGVDMAPLTEKIVPRKEPRRRRTGGDGFSPPRTGSRREGEGLSRLPAGAIQL